MPNSKSSISLSDSAKLASPSPFKLRVLITNLILSGRSGTEILTRDLAIGLQRYGHHPMVYCPRTGEIASELRTLGIPVFSDIEQIREVPDIIHGHHTIEAAVAATRFPQTPAIFVCHDFNSWYDVPPRLLNFNHFAAVGDTTYDRLTIEHGISPSHARVIANGVDIDRFKPGPALPEQPRTALIIAKNLSQIAPIQEACAIRGIETSVVGQATGQLIATPETLIPSYDLVFASGLTAIEALACQRSVIVCDGRGLAGLVTLQNYAELKRQNFGLRSLSSPLTTASILREIDLYSASEATLVGFRLRQEAALPIWISHYVDLYRQSIEEFAQSERNEDQANMRLAKHLQDWSAPNSQAWNREQRMIEAAIPTVQDGLVPLRLNIRTLPSSLRHMRLSGFHVLENWGAWSANLFCSVILKAPLHIQTYALEIEYMAQLTQGKPSMVITCLLNGEPLQTWTVTGSSPQSNIRTIDLPSNMSNADELVFLSFKTSHLVTPITELLSTDIRPLGIGLIALTLVPRPSTTIETETRNHA